MNPSANRASTKPTFIMLPARATQEMIDAGNNVGDLYRMGRPELWAQVYAAMVRVAPLAPPVPVPTYPVPASFAGDETIPDFNHLETLCKEALPGSQIDQPDQCDAEARLKMACKPELLLRLLELARKGAAV